MRVGDDGALHGLPRIDVEVAGSAIQAALGETKQSHTVTLALHAHDDRDQNRGELRTDESVGAIVIPLVE